jgi:nucleotide-binding universal stress UspA family protein
MTIRSVFAATDFSEPSRAAVDWAAGLARTLGARLIVTHVYDLPIVGFPDAALLVDSKTAARMSDAAQKQLDAEVARARPVTSDVEGLLRQGDPRVAIPELAASRDAALLVVGSHGRKGLPRALLGSVAESILRSSKVPVVVVRQPLQS